MECNQPRGEKTSFSIREQRHKRRCKRNKNVLKSLIINLVHFLQSYHITVCLSLLFSGGFDILIKF